MAKENHVTTMAPEMVEPEFVLLTAEQLALMPREEIRAYLVRRNGLSGFVPVKAIASRPMLPVGIYPSRLRAIVTHIMDNGVLRPFTSFDGMKANDDLTGVILEPNKSIEGEREFAESARQIGLMFEIVGGKYADDNKWIPMRLNLSGFKKGSESDSATLLASGEILVRDFACTADPDNPKLFHRRPDPKTESEALDISGKALGAILGLDKDSSATSDDVELALLLGEELFANVKVVEETYLGKKIHTPKFINKFDLSKADPKAVEDGENEEPFQAEKNDIFD